MGTIAIEQVRTTADNKNSYYDLPVGATKGATN
jgi:hypothetical protein